MSVERELLKRTIYFLEPLDWDANVQDTCQDLIKEITELLAQPEQEPVAWRWKDKKYDCYLYLDNGAPDYPEDCESLYTSPPKREPLSEHEILALSEKLGRLAFARAIEKAHGIGVDDDLS